MMAYPSPPQFFVKVSYQSNPTFSLVCSYQLVLGPPPHEQSYIVQLVVIQRSLVFVIFTQVMRNERERGKGRRGVGKILKNSYNKGA